MAAKPRFSAEHGALVGMATAVLLLTGCAGGHVPIEYARASAASDHGCAAGQVAVVQEQAPRAGTPGYWLDVCGSLRYYTRGPLPRHQKVGVLERRRLLATYHDMTERIDERQVPQDLRARWQESRVRGQCCSKPTHVCGDEG